MSVIKRKFARYAAEQARRAGLVVSPLSEPPSVPGPSPTETAALPPDLLPRVAHLLQDTASAAVEPDPARTTPPPLVDPARDVASFNCTNISGAELDAATGVLEVAFTNGKRYRYSNFTRELLDAWRAAESAGKWFNANVKAQPDKHPLLTGR